MMPPPTQIMAAVPTTPRLQKRGHAADDAAADRAAEPRRRAPASATPTSSAFTISATAP